MAEILAAQGIMYYRPAMWNQLQLFDQFYPLDTVNNRRIYTRTFQCLLRLEWYVTVRDKYCSNGSLDTSDTGEVTRTFHPHNCDPDRFIVPTTWRNAETEAEMNRLRRIPVKMPSAQDIANSMGASQAKAERLYNEFADYAAQRLAEHDKRDREQLDRIATEVEQSLARMRMDKIEQNDYVYISMRAPPRFKSRTMFSKSEKTARMEAMLRDDASCASAPDA
jgi:hypothetical protein